MHGRQIEVGLIWRLFHELEKGSDLYPYCDYAHGYGVPQASYFLDKAEEVSPTITLEKFESEIKVTIMSPSLTIREDQTQVEMPLIAQSIV